MLLCTRHKEKGEGCGREMLLGKGASEGWHPVPVLFDTFSSSSFSLCSPRGKRRGEQGQGDTAPTAQTPLGCTHFRGGLQWGWRRAVAPPALRSPPLHEVLLWALKQKPQIFQAASSSEVFRVPSAACSARLPAAPDEHSLTGGWEMPERNSRAPGPASPAMSHSAGNGYPASAEPAASSARAPASARPGSTLHCAGPGCDTHQGPLVPQATSCPRPTVVYCTEAGSWVCWGWQQVSSAQPEAWTGLHSSVAASWPRSPEPQSCCGRCWSLGAKSHPSPSKTTPARRQEMSQQGQLRGSGTRDCLSACSSLEAQC